MSKKTINKNCDCVYANQVLPLKNIFPALLVNIFIYVINE